MYTAEDLNQGFTIGDWDVLPAQGLLRRRGHEERPEPKVFAVLLALAVRDGNVVSQDELIDEVWDGRAFGNEPIQRCIALLRKHFDDHRPFEYIENLPRRGYRLLKPVELHSSGAVPSQATRLAARSDRRWKAVALVIALGFIAVAYRSCVPATEPDHVVVSSLAILPLQNQTGDATQQYAVDGVKNVLVQRLSEMEGLTVMNVRLPREGDWRTVARKLGVESILHGSVHEQDGALKVIYFIVNRDAQVIGSGEVMGDASDQFELHRMIAIAVRNDLSGASAPELITRPAPNRDAYRIFMRGMRALWDRGDGNNLEYSIGFFDEAIALDATYGPPYLGKATALALMPDYLGEDVETYHGHAIVAIEAGVANDPRIEAAAGAIYGFVYHKQKRWEASEQNYERAVRASFVDSNSYSWYSRMLSSVGRLEDALDMALRAEIIDPNGPIVNSRIAMAYTWLGDNDNAHKYFELANEFEATGILHVMVQTLLHVREQKYEAARTFSFMAAEIEGLPTYWIDPVFNGFTDSAAVPEALAAISRAWEERIVMPAVVLMVRTLLGDQDGAMEIARLLEEPGEAFAMELLFIPETAGLRQHAEFMPLLERLDIIQYWYETGCRWVNDRVQCED